MPSDNPKYRSVNDVSFETRFAYPHQLTQAKIEWPDGITDKLSKIAPDELLESYEVPFAGLARKSIISHIERKLDAYHEGLKKKKGYDENSEGILEARQAKWEEMRTIFESLMKFAYPDLTEAFLEHESTQSRTRTRPSLITWKLSSKWLVDNVFTLTGADSGKDEAEKTLKTTGIDMEFVTMDWPNHKLRTYGVSQDAEYFVPGFNLDALIKVDRFLLQGKTHIIPVLHPVIVEKIRQRALFVPDSCFDGDAMNLGNFLKYLGWDRFFILTEDLDGSTLRYKLKENCPLTLLTPEFLHIPSQYWRYITGTLAPEKPLSRVVLAAIRDNTRKAMKEAGIENSFTKSGPELGNFDLEKDNHGISSNPPDDDLDTQW